MRAVLGILLESNRAALYWSSLGSPMWKSIPMRHKTKNNDNKLLSCKDVWCLRILVKYEDGITFGLKHDF